MSRSATAACNRPRVHDRTLPAVVFPEIKIIERVELPPDPRRRHRDLRRCRRPARSGRDGTPEAAIRNSRTARGEQLDLAHDARQAGGAAAHEPRLGLPDQGAPRPSRYRRAVRARPPRSEVRAIDAVHATTLATPADGDLFAEIAHRDVVVQHPYDSFTTSVEASYVQRRRTSARSRQDDRLSSSHDSALAPALIEAAENGKQSVCVVELKARLDERRNIDGAVARTGRRARRLGFPDMKIHAKTTLVVRREGKGLRRYVHVGNGNYRATTARMYEDVGVFTADPDIAADVADLSTESPGSAAAAVPEDPDSAVRPPPQTGGVDSRSRCGRGRRQAGTHPDQAEQPHRRRHGRGALQGVAGRSEIDVVVRAVCPSFRASRE